MWLLDANHVWYIHTNKVNMKYIKYRYNINNLSKYYDVLNFGMKYNMCEIYRLNTSNHMCKLGRRSRVSDNCVLKIQEERSFGIQ